MYEGTHGLESTMPSFMLLAWVLMSTFSPSLKAVLLALHEGCYSEVHLVSCFLKLLSAVVLLGRCVDAITGVA